ncbi:multidrug effflux MFS transporter [Aliikangiella coralliicola]|uniref:Bcr/CflA family efflux transporter n=1 Tax=Aliikangiella coralliicola TaxID=2592383 RepID=A0A545UG75_9GAMM|nr:multidrug effflux MFS transporter [Aliikangiella coralliicola]TQV88479.1 multidrug effflux MFS transporter [Aliikangiella coralliicola]
MQVTTRVIICMGAIFSLAPFAIDMYLPALPAMATALSTDINHVEASVAIFLLGYAVSQIFLGPLSDSIGRRPVLLAGLVLFSVSSYLCGIAETPTTLYFYRFLQALGGGSSVVVFALINDRFEEKQSAVIISYIMSVVVIAPLIAPIIGGEILIRYGWEWIFYGLAGYATLVLIAAKLIVREKSKKKHASDHTNNTSKQSLTASIGSLFRSYLPIIRHGYVMSHVLSGSFAFVAGSPFVYIEYFGVQENHYGYLVALNAVAMIGVNLVNAKVLQSIPPTKKVVVGSFAIGLVSLCLILVNQLSLGLWSLVGIIVTYVGLLGLIAANAIAGAMAKFKQDGGTVSALYGVFQFGLGAVSSALVSGFHSVDATVMTSVMACCGLLALCSGFWLYRMTRTQSDNKAEKLSLN